MAYLNVYFNNELKSKHELKSIVTKIGRYPDNEIVIDNVGVSGNHAEILQQSDKYIIRDKKSTNGVYVNGELTTEKEIKLGDEIGIFKHKLRLVGIDLPIGIVDSPPIELGNPIQEGTVEIDISKLEMLLKENETDKAYLEVSSGKMSGRKFKLANARVYIGKNQDCDIHIDGWFAPKIAAKIVRQSDGYHLVPEKRGKVRHNGGLIKTRTKLKNGSDIEIRKTKFRFLNIS
jgi:predicted component of type VI protein secretion system